MTTPRRSPQSEHSKHPKHPKPSGSGATTHTADSAQTSAASPAAARQTPVAANFDPSILQFGPATSDRFVYSKYFAPLDFSQFTGVPIVAGLPQAAVKGAGKTNRRNSILPPGGTNPGSANTAQTLAQMLGSNVGLLFLDRTRIVPQNSVLGEELMSLSLAPGETVVIQQQTFSKKTVSFEEQNEQDQQVSLQYDATLTTAMEENLANQQQNSDKTTSGISGSLGGTYDGVSVSVSPSYSHTVDAASTATQQHSTKNSQTASSQVASTSRTQHKTVMRISSEQTFQNTSQRTLVNPNKFTPIDLRYFKIYLKMALRLERYGVRLAWAPTIQNPGQAVIANAQAAYQAALAAAAAGVSLPAAPTPPTPPPTVPPVVVTAPAPPLSVSQGNVFSGGVSQNNTINLAIPSGYQWDGNTPTPNVSIVHGSLNSANPVTVQQAYVSGANLVVEIHEGWPGGGTALITVSANFVGIPTSADTAYQTALAQYQQQLAAYNVQVQSLQAAAQAAALPTAQAAYEAVVTSADPLTECLTQLVKSLPAGDYATPAMIDVLTTVFDWSGATVKLYASWWGGTEPKDPSDSATSFVNASWARVFLPVVPGMESVALNIIAAIQGLTLIPTSASQLVQQITDYRTQWFGDPNETPLQPDPNTGFPQVLDKFQCLAEWSEVLPTEGTHLEVLQASTEADDVVSDQQLAAMEAVRTAEANALNGAATKVDRLSLSVVIPDGQRRCSGGGGGTSGVSGSGSAG